MARVYVEAQRVAAAFHLLGMKLRQIIENQLKKKDAKALRSYKMAAKKKDVVKKEEGLPQILGGQGPAAGFEEADSSAYAIPFLRILQALSPEVDEDDSAYVEGAKQGMIYHTVRKEVYSEVEVIPVFYRKTFIEWVTRENGGGFRGEHELHVGQELLRTCSRDDKNRFILPESGHQLAETANHYVLFKVGEDFWEPCLMSMSSSQLKASRNWMSNLRGQSIVLDGKRYGNLNMEAYVWKASTEKLENDKGKWYGWTFEQLHNTLELEHIPEAASSTRDAVAMNAITYDRSQQQEGTESEQNAF